MSAKGPWGPGVLRSLGLVFGVDLNPMAVQLARALGASAGFWLNLQKNWELSQVDEKRFQRITKMAA